jgi:TolB-like protein/tetratricopeptide (TPR) repeat protein
VSRLSAFLSELKRRRVYHVAVAYSATAFVIAEAGDIFLPRLGLPDWTVTLVVVLAVIGFPVALVLGWTFDITPGGVRRTSATDPRAPIPRPGRLRIAGGAVVIAAVLVAGGWWLSNVAFVASASGINRLAVLPLANLTNDAEQQHFVDAMHDAVIAELAQIRALTVISRQSVMRYRGSDKSVPEIARELDVSALVQGSVTRVADSVRITAQLVQAQPTERPLWTGTFQRELHGVLSLQAEVARAITEHIRVAITPDELTRLTRTRGAHPAAYQAWLRGWAAANTGTRVGVKRCIEEAERATEIDPRYAAAYGLAAGCYTALTYVADTRPDEAMPKARAAALRAIEIDPSLGEGHRVLAWTLAAYDWDWAGAEAAFRRALELDPGSAATHGQYSIYLAWMGRHTEALAAARRAHELSPGHPGPRTNLAVMLFARRRYDEALAQARLGVEMAPDFGFAYDRLAWAYEGKAMFDESVAAREKAVELMGDGRRGALGRAYALAGRHDDARRVLDDMLGLEKTSYVPPIQIAYVLEALGRHEEAIDWLERGYDTRDGHMPLINGFPAFDALRPHPRFQQLVRRMNFPD